MSMTRFFNDNSFLHQDKCRCESTASSLDLRLTNHSSDGLHHLRPPFHGGKRRIMDVLKTRHFKQCLPSFLSSHDSKLDIIQLAKNINTVKAIKANKSHIYCLLLPGRCCTLFVVPRLLGAEKFCCF